MPWIEEFFFSPIFAASFLWAAWRMIAMVVITCKQLKLDWKEYRRQREEQRRYEAELIAWRFAQPPLELTPKEIAGGWQVIRFRCGAQCKMLSADVIMRKLCGPVPFVPPKEPYVFEDVTTKLQAFAMKPTWSPYEFAEDLARRRAALKDFEF